MDSSTDSGEKQYLDPTYTDVEKAATALRDGKLVAFPTETVYGLGCDATNDDAVAAVFEAKGRPTFNPLIIHVADAGQAALVAKFDDTAQKLAAAFWPGALTLVLNKTDDCPVSLLATAGLDTIAVRVPAHAVAHELLKAMNGPVAAPSANVSGTVSPTDALHVGISLNDKVDYIIDGGSCEVGIESTIVDLTGATPTLLRPGGIAVEDIEALIGPLASPETDEVKAPGQLKSHYAPAIDVRINVAPEDRLKGEAYLTFGPDAPRRAALNLSKAGDLKEAAANLFAMLRALDQPGIRAIAVQPIPNEGLGRAINDRLERAAAPRAADNPNQPAACPGAGGGCG